MNIRVRRECLLKDEVAGVKVDWDAVNGISRASPIFEGIFFEKFF